MTPKSVGKWILLVVALGVLPGCYQKHLVLRAEAVSMTETAPPADKKLSVGSEVRETWCMGQPPVYQPDARDEEFGLADQVIYKAQKGGKKADFITQVRIYRDTDGCAILNGKLAKLSP